MVIRNNCIDRIWQSGPLVAAPPPAMDYVDWSNNVDEHGVVITP